MLHLDDMLFESFKGREVNIGEIVEVYRNLKLKDGFSIRSAKTKKVLAHCSSAMLQDCSFVVMPGGRKRTVARRQKEVHAVVRGELVSINSVDSSEETIRYNPYLYSTFVQGAEDEPVFEAAKVNCYQNTVYLLKK